MHFIVIFKYIFVMFAITHLLQLFLYAENRPDESFFVKLDSNLKRNTAFVKKLVSVCICSYMCCNLM